MRQTYFLTPVLFESLLSEGERKSPRLFSDFYRDTNDAKLFRQGYSLRQRAESEGRNSYTLFSKERGKEKATIERVAELIGMIDPIPKYLFDLVPSVEAGMAIKRYYFEGKRVDFVRWLRFGISGMIALISLPSFMLHLELQVAPEAHLVCMHHTGTRSCLDEKLFSSCPIILTKEHAFSKYFSLVTIDNFMKELEDSEEDEKELT
jgi:hypothetical protein